MAAAPEPIVPEHLPALAHRAPEPAQVAEAVLQLRQVAVRFDALADAHPDEWQGLTYLRAVLRVLISDLRTVERKVEDFQAKAMPGYQVDVEGVGRIKRHGGKGWGGWEDERLAHVLAMRVATDPDTGDEVDLAPRVLAMRVADELLACARVNWRVTALTERGIDLEDYADRKRGRATVQMPRMEG